MVRVHSCLSNERIAQGFEEPPAKKCRCRKFISLAKATALVKKGEAKWVVVGRTRSQEYQTCPLCLADKQVRNCAQCAGFGKIERTVTLETYNNDIVRVAQFAVDKDTPYKPILSKKTPRTMTIEKANIERAVLENDIEEQERIEVYGLMILEARMTFMSKDSTPENTEWGRPGILHHG